MSVPNPLNPKKKKNGKSDTDTRGPIRQFSSQIIAVVLIFLIIASIYSLVVSKGKDIQEISVSQLVADVKKGEVIKITATGNELTIDYKDGQEKTSKKEVDASLSETLSNLGVTSEDLSKVEIDVKSESGFFFWLLNLLPIIAPILFIVLFIWLISRQVKGQTMQAFSFGQSKARIIDPDDSTQKVSFKDVAGSKEAKEELQEIVDFLKNPKKFLDIGARIPKGVILMGAPGTGKTLLARAVAGEARVPFLYLSGSEFVEMFVGVGASRVRDLFKMAKKIAPSIIFVDEIDAVGRHRGSGYGGGNDEREQTLNQILVEMDGFEPNEKVIIMAATNRPDVLDPALLRPGRFDRRVVLELPDRKEREEILMIHRAKRPLHDDVDLKVVAERTPGFSGADLANLMNEAAILAARENRKSVTQYDLLRSIEKVMMGPERKSTVMGEKEKKITAYHEGGHALVASVLEHADPVHKVTVIPRGRAGGYTLKLPLEERRYQFKNQFLDDIAVSLAGYTAEKIIFGDVTTGGSNDIAVSTALARNMVSRYGMSDVIGPVSFDEDRVPFGGMPTIGKPYSEEVAAKLDVEVAEIMKTAEKRANEAIVQHRKVLDAIADKLIEVETLEREDFEKVLILNGIEPKRKPENEKGLVIAE